MTDRELLEHAKEWFDGIDKQLQRTQSGNFMHHRETIRSTAVHAADFIDNYLKEKV